MNNLTPEPRTDINGKVTTRWVRKVSEGTSKALLSAPPAIAPNALPPFTNETAPLTSLAMEDVFPHGRPCEVSDLNPLAIQGIERMLEEAKDESLSSYLVAEGNFLRVLYDARDNIRKWGRQENSKLINDISVLSLKAASPNPKHVVAGLRTYPDFKDVDDFLYGMNEDMQEKARALYVVIGAVEKQYRDEYFLEDDKYGEREITWQEEDTQYIRLRNPDLAKFVIDHPELSDSVIRVVKERCTDDVALIKDILDGEVRALGGGTL